MQKYSLSKENLIITAKQHTKHGSTYTVSQKRVPRELWLYLCEF